MQAATEEIRLTQYSHGAGCGCKISPAILDSILESNISIPDNQRLLVGNHSKDDAAVYDLGNGMGLISTTDFFMPIVDDPFTFGRIASANAISDVYAMGGKPVLAIAILGWPIHLLGPEIARQVVSGSRSICAEAGIPLAGGHSIDNPEPLFGLAVNGLVSTSQILRNNTGRAGDVLLLTKPLGVGILTTAAKKNILKKEHGNLAPLQMMQLNKVGEALGAIEGVHAMTDVTGFGLLGHLAEMAAGSGLSAEVFMNEIPLITPDLAWYIAQKSVPGGTARNWDSYGAGVAGTDEFSRYVLADPQTSGGLLVAVAPAALENVTALFRQFGLQEFCRPIGRLTPAAEVLIQVH